MRMRCALAAVLIAAARARAQALPPEHMDPSWTQARPPPRCTADPSQPWCSRAARLGCAARPARGEYNTTGWRVLGGGVLNVHIVPHSHDDVGWLKTVDEYYIGSNQSIQVAGVQFILDSVVEQLAADRRRSFVIVETAFFARWWWEQPERTRATVRRLVANGQLTFANGGWCMSDEATPFFADMVEQQTAGLRFLARELGVVPSVGWQVDPFGHSAFMATLYALLGVRAYGFGRIDYQDRAKREAERTLEAVQSASPSLGPQAALLAGVMRGYGPPAGFNWEWFDGAGLCGPGSQSPAAPLPARAPRSPPSTAARLRTRPAAPFARRAAADDPIQDDPSLRGHNVDATVAAFVAAALEQAEHYAHCEDGDCDVMFTLGSDFHYGNARAWYKSIDKLLHYAKADGRVNAFYSSPQSYFAAKTESAHRWTVKSDDFMPYCDGEAGYDASSGRVLDEGGHAFWTGFYSSRPALKLQVRHASAALQACRQLELLFPPKPNAAAGAPGALSGAHASCAAPRQPRAPPSSVALWLALSVAQHHDAVSGTARQHVTDDYQQRLAEGAAECDALISAALDGLAAGGADGQADGAQGGEAPAAAGAPQAAAAAFLAWAPCPLNETYCARTFALPHAARTVRVAVYNPRAQPVAAQLVRIPVPAGSAVRATGADGAPLATQVLPLGRRASVALVRVQAVPAVGGTWLDLTLLPAGAHAADATPADAAATANADTDRGAGSGAGSGAVLPGLLRAGERELRLQSDSLALHLAQDEATGAVRTTLLRARGAGSGRWLSARLAIGAAFYPSHNGDAAESCGQDRRCRPGQASGAYIFRPNCTEGPVQPCAPTPVSAADGGGGGGADGGVRLTRLSRGALCEEAELSFAPWANLTLSACAGARALRVAWAVGPIPIGDGQGKEVVLRYASDLRSGRRFGTDSNGRDMLTRTRDARPSWQLNVTDPVAGNYYPVTALLTLAEPAHATAASGGAGGAAARQLSVHVDRAQGGSSLCDGCLELMVHRRTLLDDNRGVAEALNETECGCRGCACAGLHVAGVHWVQLSAVEAPGATPGGAMREARQLLAEVQYPLLLRFSTPRPLPSEDAHQPPTRDSGGGALPAPFGALRSPLDPQLHLLTAHDLTAADVPTEAQPRTPPPARRGGGVRQLLLRLSHSVAAEEGGTPVPLDLSALFEPTAAKLLSVEEQLLGANARADPTRAGDPAPFRTATPLSPAPFVPVRGSVADTKVVISPLEIRTWLAEYV